jgi:hypothetical protein
MISLSRVSTAEGKVFDLTHMSRTFLVFSCDKSQVRMLCFVNYRGRGHVIELATGERVHGQPDCGENVNWSCKASDRAQRFIFVEEHAPITDLCFRVIQGDHIPEKSVQDAFNLEEKRRSITPCRIGVTRYTTFVHRTPSSTSQSVKGIQAGHFGRTRQRVVGSIENCDEFRVILQH